MSEGTSMPEIQISVDPEVLRDLQERAARALFKVERATKVLHGVMKEVEELFITKLPPGTIAPMSGGGKEDPPPPGGGG